MSERKRLEEEVRKKLAVLDLAQKEMRKFVVTKNLNEMSEAERRTPTNYKELKKAVDGLERANREFTEAIYKLLRLKGSS